LDRRDEANEKTCNAHSEGPRKCHGNRESKKIHTDVTARRKLRTVSFLYLFTVFA
jgi:hypothetical protein